MTRRQHSSNQSERTEKALPQGLRERPPLSKDLLQVVTIYGFLDAKLGFKPRRCSEMLPGEVFDSKDEIGTMNVSSGYSRSLVLDVKLDEWLEKGGLKGGKLACIRRTRFP